MRQNLTRADLNYSRTYANDLFLVRDLRVSPMGAFLHLFGPLDSVNASVGH